MLVLLVFLFGTLVPVTGWSQIECEQWLQQLESGDTEQKIAAMRALSTMVIRQHATAVERTKIREALSRNAKVEIPVIRLAANVELLKMGAAEDDRDLIGQAVQAMHDDDINVRRGMARFFRNIGFS